jgi:hypothetical protein
MALSAHNRRKEGAEARQTRLTTVETITMPSIPPHWAWHTADCIRRMERAENAISDEINVKCIVHGL